MDRVADTTAPIALRAVDPPVARAVVLPVVIQFPTLRAEVRAEVQAGHPADALDRSVD